MIVDQLRKAYDKRPFEPFEIYLVDGRVLPVPHRDFLFVPPTAQRLFAVADKKGLIEWVDLLLVVSLKPIAHKGNGRRRKSA